ncbi:hypothetical protein C0991_008917 [Blastosporella zonata]|nr:hypothetical protein C0991_008917 [Blastosporella zonata]
MDEGTTKKKKKKEMSELCCQFITAVMKENQSMESWIGEVRSLSNCLTAINVAVLIAGLPNSYNTIIILFDTLDPEKLTLEFVITCLLNEESRQAPPSTSSEVKQEDNTALFAKDTGSNITCFWCGEKGHYAVNCPKRKEVKPAESANLTATSVTNGSWWETGDNVTL